ncbi:hypothetical protein NX059_008914 [Plenodomus lindquistii]|nr:hypothetical protein NX059_008914 [Plenodomus lindquistii]
MMAPSRGTSLLGAWRALPCDFGFSARQHAVQRACCGPLGRHGRAIHSLHSSRLPCNALSFRPHATTHTNANTPRRCASSFKVSKFAEQLADPANKLQSYVSSSNDPYINLAIEDYIMHKSSPKSTILFLYVNRPCVVIGRNQNPWTEVNLGILDATRGAHQPKDAVPPALGAVDLVRRRSGGGTVFHDKGNLNWSVICPRADFTRDQHAEMTVRALRKLGVSRARVNERHDIVLDQGPEKRPSDPKDTHRTPYTVDDDALPRPLKVSGSAFKLIRERALHHATTLLCSPNLHIISQYLRSPAKEFIQAKGVQSVSSPVDNIGLKVSAFKPHMQNEFAAMYAAMGPPTITQTLDEDYVRIRDIRKGYEQLRSEDWTWSQTPQFDLQLDSKSDVGISMKVHGGIITRLEFENDSIPWRTQEDIRELLVGQKLQDIRRWEPFLRHGLRRWDEPVEKMAKRLEEILPLPKGPNT